MGVTFDKLNIFLKIVCCIVTVGAIGAAMLLLGLCWVLALLGPATGTFLVFCFIMSICIAAFSWIGLRMLCFIMGKDL